MERRPGGGARTPDRGGGGTPNEGTRTPEAGAAREASQAEYARGATARHIAARAAADGFRATGMRAVASVAETQVRRIAGGPEAGRRMLREIGRAAAPEDHVEALERDSGIAIGVRGGVRRADGLDSESADRRRRARFGDGELEQKRRVEAWR